MWRRRDDWTDGYLNHLPVGPPPMVSETCYLYRTITAPQAMKAGIHLYARDNVRVWLNGEVVGQAHNPNRAGSSRFAASLVADLAFEPGPNRLLDDRGNRKCLYAAAGFQGQDRPRLPGHARRAAKGPPGPPRRPPRRHAQGRFRRIRVAMTMAIVAEPLMFVRDSLPRFP